MNQNIFFKNKTTKKKEKDIRREFPFFLNNKNIVYLDNAATHLKPKVVIDAINEYYKQYSVNIHNENSNFLFIKVKEVVQETRQLIVNLVNGNSLEEVIFFPSATYALNVLSLACREHLKKGNKIALTYLEHSSNCFPWQHLAQETESEIFFLPLNDQWKINLEDLKKIRGEIKIIVITQTNNSLGVVQPLEKIIKLVKTKNPCCLVVVDACQSISQEEILAKKWMIDVLFFSAHKFYGPIGLGVMWINQKTPWTLKNVFWGGGKKISPMENKKKKIACFPLYYQWEVGTIPLAEIFGFRAALRWFKKKEIKQVKKYLFFLKKYTVKHLMKIKATVFSSLCCQSNIVSFNFLDYHPHDVVDYLGKKNVIVRGGDLCCPYLKKIIGVSSVIRISFALYNNTKEIDKLIWFLQKIKNYSSFLSLL